MSLRKTLPAAVAAAALLLAAELAAQTTNPPAPRARKQIQAVRLQGPPPLLDGRLDDPAWQAAPVLSDFTQKQPDEGAAPTERTEVRFVYDEDALYVAARMFKNPGSALQAPVARRDDGAQAEHLWISLDTWLDRRTAYSFGITAAGTRMDWYHPRDDEYDIDMSYDPVWEGKAARDSAGWTAELKIPFSQLRFNAGAAQTWGLNIDRWNPATQEDVFWIPVPTQAQGWASHFGELTGITGIRPTRRLEILPYVATGATLTAEPGEGNPFNDGSELEARFGGDVKMGIGPNLTLEGTVNPDFGQVEADPAEVNLSAFETFFSERRPFFIEGSQLLEGSGPSYFYSRRIGATPFIDVEGDYLDYPRTSTILGAGKLTGTLPRGTSLGVLAAVTDGEEARVFDVESRAITSVTVAPRTGYAVGRMQQQFGPAQSTAGLLLTAMGRDLPGEGALPDLLHRNAVAGGADWNLRFRGGEYSLAGYAGFSRVEGDEEAIAGTQLSSARYFDRPDADYVRFDPARTSLAGWAGSLQARRLNGRHWLWTLYGAATSPGFEINDAGFQNTADDVVGVARLRYRETRPAGLFRNYSVQLSSENQWNFGGVRNFSAIRTDVTATWKNFWGTDFIAWVDLRSQSDELTRGGPLMGTGAAWVTILNVYNSFASTRRWQGRVYYGRNELGELTYRLSGSFSMRPTPRWRLTVSPNYLWSTNPRQYVATLPGGPSETFGDRYVFSEIDRSTFLMQFRLNYTFTPDLSLEVYAEPFAASGRYQTFGELDAPRSRGLNSYEATGLVTSCREGLVSPDHPCAGRQGRHLWTGPGGPFAIASDFNVRSFRSNAVLRWEWRPGSTLFAVWQQDRFSRVTEGSPVDFGDLGGTLDAPGDNRLVLKATYWIPVR